MGNRGSFPGGESAGAWSRPLTSILVPRSRMRGVIPPPRQYASMAWCSVKKHRDRFTFSLLSYVCWHQWFNIHIVGCDILFLRELKSITFQTFHLKVQVIIMFLCIRFITSIKPSFMVFRNVRKEILSNGGSLVIRNEMCKNKCLIHANENQRHQNNSPLLSYHPVCRHVKRVKCNRMQQVYWK
jgi:hypothetical protein